MSPVQIADEAALERAWKAPLFLLVKHSLICPISERAFSQYERFLTEGSEVPNAWLDVIGQRPISLGVAERTGVAHESPQALLLQAGRVVWHASHGAITVESLGEAVAHSRSK